MVSVVIPTYNREQVIGRAIWSVLQQTYQEYEIIIVDDGSTDNTAKVVRKIEDERISYIPLERNYGVAHARNVGIAHAKYDYIAFLDSDDEWLPEKLALQIDKLQKSSRKTGLVYCRMGGETRKENERYIFPPEEYTANILEGNLFFPLLQQNVIGTPTAMFRKECLEQIGGANKQPFYEKLICLEDWEMILRAAKEWKVAFVDEVLVEVHKTPKSVSTNAGGYLLSRCYMVSLYKEQMKQAGILEKITEEILQKAACFGLQEETKELLHHAMIAPLQLP